MSATQTTSLIASSPSSSNAPLMRPTSSFTELEQKLMRKALELAENAYECWEVPVGCVFANGEEIIATGRNKTNETRNGTKHAEFVALESLTRTLETKKGDGDDGGDGVGDGDGDGLLYERRHPEKLDVYVTCEPCIMCASMLGQLPFARVKVIFGCANDKFGGGGTCLSVHELCGLPSCLQSDTADDGSFSSSKAYECVGGLFKDEAVELFQRFYVRGNPKAPAPHREVREYPS